MIFDPKLVKQIVHSQLIQSAQLVGVKKADTLKKESLIPAFIKAVEALSEEKQEKLDEKVVNMYNGIVQLFGLDKETEGQEEQPSGAEGTGVTEVETPPSVPVVETPVEAPSEQTKVKEVKDMSKAIPTKAKPAKVKKEKKEKVAHHSWYQVGFEVIKDLKANTTKEGLTQKILNAYVAKGGSNNEKAASFCSNVAAIAGVVFGKITIDGDKILLAK